MRQFFVALILLAVGTPGLKTRGSELAGQQAAVAAGAIGGTVVDVQTGDPIGEAVVHIQPATGNAPAPLQMTDAKGRFLFAGLSAGSYSVRASRTGYTDSAYGADTDNGIAVMPIVIESGQHFLDAKI